MKIGRMALLIFGMNFLIGCQNMSHSNSFAPQKIESTETFDLKIKGDKSVTERVKLQSESYTRTTEKGQLRKETTEIVDFTVENQLRKSSKDILFFKITTIEKDGPTSLVDLGFPEFGESLDIAMTPKAKVKKAGHYPKNSLFYVPPISLPDAPVKVGDTWVLEKSWVSLQSGVPLKVSMVSIFKNLYSCGLEDKCAEIEVGGKVTIARADLIGMNLNSELVGRILFNIDKGQIIWSDIRNIESVSNGSQRIEIRSCTEAVLIDPPASRWLWRGSPNCDPRLPLPDKIPGA